MTTPNAESAGGCAGGDGGAVGSVGGTADNQRRLKPTPATKSALKPTGTGIPTRFHGFAVAVADTELIRWTDVLEGLVARWETIGGTATNQRRLKPTPATKSALKPTGTGIPTRFKRFPIAATAADTELIRRAGYYAATGVNVNTCAIFAARTRLPVRNA